MSPRRSVADAGETHRVILERSVAMASVEGLEGVSIGHLSEAVGLSKSGVLRHFATKEELQLATLTAAMDTFRADVWEPVAELPAGRRRLLALCDAWLWHLESDTFPGGCFLTAAACEFDDRPGPVRDALVVIQGRWIALLENEVRTARRAGDLPPGTDPEAVAFTLNALAMGLNQARRLLHDDRASEHVWRTIRALLCAPHARRKARPPRAR
jgi:AcrR family transcriptional regulator